MRIRFNVKGYMDRRTTSLLARHDVVLERIWRARVERNSIARRAIEKHAETRRACEFLVAETR